MQSCIYEGHVHHRRLAPKAHEFHYSVFMVYLDLAELGSVFKGRWLWSTRRAALARFRREDHLGDPALPLDECVRSLVFERLGTRPEGPIRLLTHLRYFGYCFNPLSVYYCFDAADTRLEYIVLEVNNTPWGERHCYVLRAPEGSAAAGPMRFRFPKTFHVSPFLPLDMTYDVSVKQPGTELCLYMADEHNGATVLKAALALKRRPISGLELARVLFRYPFMTAKVILAIYGEALRLWAKKVPFIPHPPASAPQPSGE